MKYVFFNKVEPMSQTATRAAAASAKAIGITVIKTAPGSLLIETSVSMAEQLGNLLLDWNYGPEHLYTTSDDDD